jgi:hypothetical protein
MQVLSLTLKGFRGIRDGLRRDTRTLDFGMDNMLHAYAHLAVSTLNCGPNHRAGTQCFTASAGCRSVGKT